MSVQNSIFRIRSFAKARGLSRRALADLAGIGDTTIRNIDEPDWNPTADTLRKLEAIIPADLDAKYDNAPEAEAPKQTLPTQPPRALKPSSASFSNSSTGSSKTERVRGSA